MRRSLGLTIALLAGLATTTVQAQPVSSPGDPPARVGRLAFIDGTVSFHDSQQTDWSRAYANTPLTTGDAIWTEPGARSEISIAGTRVRMDGASELDMLAVDDSQTRLQLDQGRIDIKTFTYDNRQPYQIVTPRGVVTLEEQGDYYVLAGSTQDPTQLGVRSGAAQIQAANGQVLAVRAGEIGEISGDYDSPVLRTMHTAPPPMPQYWAQRDREIVYEQPQYVSYGVTGYEDLNYYGTWQADPEYGEVWIPRYVPVGWAPYRTGHWAFIPPWGWTWVDDQPWGFAPYHYGRWAHRGDRWMWVAPERDPRPVYAPALVAFVGGVELGIALGVQSQPVGWFPLGPREVYVPPYTRDRDYFHRLNIAARVQERDMDDRWQRAERREALRADERNEQLMNSRFATVVPAQAFTRSEPVQRVALRVDPQKLSAAPVAPVAAPPAPTMALRANAPAPGQAQPQVQAQPQTRPQAPGANVPTAQTRLANMETLGRPTGAEAPRHEAPGPKVAAHTNPQGNAQGGKPNLPQLAPHNPNAPAPVQQPGQGHGQPQAQQPQPHPQAERTPPQTAPNALPPVRGPNAQRPPEPPRPNQAQHPEQAQSPNEPPRATPATPATPPTAPQQSATPATPATPSPNAQQQHVTPPPQRPQQAERPNEPPRATPATPPTAPQQRATPAMPSPNAQQHVNPPHQAEMPRPQPQPQMQMQHQAPPPPQQHAAPPPMPQHHEQAHAPPAPPPPQHMAPPPQQQHAAPSPPPQQHAAPPPPPQQHQQAQSPPQHQNQKDEKK